MDWSNLRGTKTVDATIRTPAAATPAPTPTLTELVPVEGYGASEAQFGWMVGGVAIAAAGVLGWWLFGKSTKKRGRKGRKRIR